MSDEARPRDAYASKNVFKNIKRGIKWSSSKSSYIQVLHQQIREGWGSKSVLIALTQGGWGVQNYGKHADIILERSLIS